MRNHLNRLSSATNKTVLLLGVMCLNFLFVGVDVLMAHSQNSVFRLALIPLIFSPFAVVAILARLTFRTSSVVRRAFQGVMWLGVCVGVLGTFFHLTGNAGAGQDSLHRLLVEGSPFAAPIAFAGISVYALASEHYEGAARRSRLLTLVGLGFLGAVLAAYLDHARLSFVPGYTLIPLIPGTLAAMSCFYLARRPVTTQETHLYLYVLGLSMLVGLLGFCFHVLGDLAGTQDIVWARLLYRNPVLGPLLFCDLAVLGALSILPESKAQETESNTVRAGVKDLRREGQTV